METWVTRKEIRDQRGETVRGTHPEFGGASLELSYLLGNSELLADGIAHQANRSIVAEQDGRDESSDHWNALGADQGHDAERQKSCQQERRRRTHEVLRPNRSHWHIPRERDDQRYRYRIAKEVHE